MAHDYRKWMYIVSSFCASRMKKTLLACLDMRVKTCPLQEGGLRQLLTAGDQEPST